MSSHNSLKTSSEMSSGLGVLSFGKSSRALYESSFKNGCVKNLFSSCDYFRYTRKTFASYLYICIHHFVFRVEIMIIFCNSIKFEFYGAYLVNFHQGAIQKLVFFPLVL